MIHYPTCNVWQASGRQECNCPPAQIWRIRRVGRYWVVSRYLDDRWTRFMATTNHAAACQLVASMQWLSLEGLRRVS